LRKLFSSHVRAELGSIFEEKGSLHVRMELGSIFEGKGLVRM
jgi:hypothetical protein